MPAVVGCGVVLKGVRLEEIKAFKYLGTVFSNHDKMEGEISKRVMKRRSVMRTLAKVMNWRNVSTLVKRGPGLNILQPTLTYASKVWRWNRAQQSRVCLIKISYLRGTCGVSRWASKHNESIYERHRMSHVEW